MSENNRYSVIYRVPRAKNWTVLGYHATITDAMEQIRVHSAHNAMPSRCYEIRDSKRPARWDFRKEYARGPDKIDPVQNDGVEA